MNDPFYIVDVFAIDRYTGNQLAVFPNASQISDRAMQNFAKEINFSETTFITSSSAVENSYDVRIFTPNQEIPFAGHPTLGTAYVIREYLMSTSEKVNVDQVILNLKAGKIPVTWKRTEKGEEVFWMQQNEPEFGEIISPSAIAPVLSLSETEINPNFPIQEVSTGLEFLIIPVNTLSALKQIQINKEAYYQLIASLQAKSLLVFCSETYSSENDLCVRVFADYLGIPEDPATGSANGCLAAYLYSNQVFPTQERGVQVRVEQGYEIDRPSLLFLDANEERVAVGGQVCAIAQGNFCD